jgi:hypothetical protein
VRPARLWAIARQDWALELGGRQGLLLPGLLLGLLAGPALAPKLELGGGGFVADGDVPAAVAALPQRPGGAPLSFRRTPTGLEVTGELTAEVRAALDGPTPALVVESVGPTPRFPGRTALFGLISASTLSGAVAASIGGERSRKTLGVLLAAAVSRAEVVAGKALAWGGFGLGSVVAAATVSIALGRVSPGWWLLPLVTLPLATVALGFWLVRRATDVVAGTATSMRVLPAVVAVSGLFAFLLGVNAPLLGALVPIGGALVAAGDAWPGPLPALVAAGSTLAFAVAALGATVRDLEEVPSEEARSSPNLEALAVAALGGACWWNPICAPLLYAAAGRPQLLDKLPLSSGVAAGAACLLVGTVLHVSRRPGATVATGWPAPWTWALAVPAAALAWATHRAPVLVLGWPTVAERLREAATLPGAAGALSVVAGELLFRGWLPERLGPLRAVLVATVVTSPLDPLGAVVEAAALVALARAAGSVWPGVLARLLAMVALSSS